MQFFIRAHICMFMHVIVVPSSKAFLVKKSGWADSQLSEGYFWTFMTQKWQFSFFVKFGSIYFGRIKIPKFLRTNWFKENNKLHKKWFSWRKTTETSQLEWHRHFSQGFHKLKNKIILICWSCHFWPVMQETSIDIGWQKFKLLMNKYSTISVRANIWYICHQEKYGETINHKNVACQFHFSIISSLFQTKTHSKLILIHQLYLNKRLFARIVGRTDFAYLQNESIRRFATTSMW